MSDIQNAEPTTNQSAAATSGSNSQGTQATAQAPQAPEGLGWRAGLAKDLQEHEAFKGFGKVTDLAKDYLSLKDRSQRMFAVPTDESTEDERKAYMKALGIPEAPDGYQEGDFPEGYQAEPERLQAWRAQAHELGLTPKQYQQMVSKAVEAHQKHLASTSEARKARESELDAKIREEWKDQYDINRELAHRAAREFMTEDDVKEAEEKGYFTSPWFVRLMHKAGEAIGEGRFVKGGAASPQRPMTAVEYHTD